MILNDEDIDKAKLAGKIAGKAIIYGRKLIKPGVKVVDVLDQIEDFIHQNNGKIAFPAQISINEFAAHFCPLEDDETIIKSTDMVKLDLGVHIDGIIADNAITIIFKEDNDKYEELNTIKKASEEALKNAIDIIKPGITLGEIGLMIQETIANYDLSPIKNLSGHGLGKYSVHEHPTIPNFNTNDKTELKENQIIAIEPFATNGYGMVFESKNPTLFSFSKNRPVRSTYAREILSEIKKFENLPFTTRWLTKKINPGKVKLGLNELKINGIIHEYPPLIESKRGIVSQTEHTVIVRDKPVITTLIDE
ncbi:MAG: type II methionyl aminopeptidase [Candidatus Woesearchaeota archaeon]|nr:MAG: type II methionyl aminopeptidase [Candidatus Woesearchaeota archaeon]